MIRALHLQRAFTLIELLVVISIIGMLSSVVLAAVGGARDKGRIGAGLTFATHNYHALGADAFSQYDFNGSVIGTDISGNARDVTCSGVSADLTKKPGTSGSSGSFNGTGGCAKTYSSGYPTISDKWTISAWVYVAAAADIDAAGETIVRVDPSGGPGNAVQAHMLVYDPASNGTKVVMCAQGAYSDNDALITGLIRIGAWNHIACTYDGTSVSAYLDGSRVGSPVVTTIYSSRLVSGIGIGRYSGSVINPFKGNLDDVAIYSQALAAGDIEKLYAAGLPTHNLAQK